MIIDARFNPFLKFICLLFEICSNHQIDFSSFDLYGMINILVGMVILYFYVLL